MRVFFPRVSTVTLWRVSYKVEVSFLFLAWTLSNIFLPTARRKSSSWMSLSWYLWQRFNSLLWSRHVCLLKLFLNTFPCAKLLSSALSSRSSLRSISMSFHIVVWSCPTRLFTLKSYKCWWSVSQCLKYLTSCRNWIFWNYDPILDVEEYPQQVT